MVEMPRLPGLQLFAVNLDDAHVRAGADSDHAGQLFGIGALDR